MRKRVNITVSAEEHRLLERGARRAGMRGPCQLVRAIVALMLRKMAEPAPEPTDEEWLAAEFEALADWEPRPDGNPPRRGRRREP